MLPERLRRSLMLEIELTTCAFGITNMSSKSGERIEGDVGTLAGERDNELLLLPRFRCGSDGRRFSTIGLAGLECCGDDRVEPRSPIGRKVIGMRLSRDGGLRSDCVFFAVNTFMETPKKIKSSVS